jgi:MraZ protein
MLHYCGYKWVIVGNKEKMFKGISNLSIDIKGRASMPQRYRSDFDANKLVITADKDKCLLIYTQSNWAVIEKKLSELPSYNKEARFIQRLLIGHATESEIDTQGRFLIPIPLREYASIKTPKKPVKRRNYNLHASKITPPAEASESAHPKVVLLGQGNKFELWSETLWNRNIKRWISEQNKNDFSNGALSELKL